MTDFKTFGLSGPVLEALDKMGFVEATPIQKKAIPLVMEGRDVLGQAQTGTGKTAAFGIPIAERLDPDAPHVQALILSPTRELAVQIAEEVHEITLFTGHKVLPVYGGQRIDRQITALKKDGVVEFADARRCLVPDFVVLLDAVGEDADGGMID